MSDLVAPVKMQRWDTGTLSWTVWSGDLQAGSLVIGGVTQSGTWTVQPGNTANTTAWRVDPNYIGLTAASGSVASSGNNTLITPAAGKKLRVYYCSYNPALAVEAAFRFGAAGTLFLRNSITANSVIAKDFGALRYVEGAVNEVFILNLSLAVSTIWNTFYVEV